MAKQTGTFKTPHAEVTKTTSQPAGKGGKQDVALSSGYTAGKAHKAGDGKRASLPAIHKPNQTVTQTPVQSAVSSLGLSGIKKSFKDAADQISGSGPSKSGSASSPEALAPNASFDRSKYQSIVKKSMIGGKL
jgi:hypothetical protein